MLAIGKDQVSTLNDLSEHIMPEWFEELASRFMESEQRVSYNLEIEDTTPHLCWFTEYRLRTTMDPSIFHLQANFWTNPIHVPSKASKRKRHVVITGYKATMIIDVNNSEEVAYVVEPVVRFWNYPLIHQKVNVLGMAIRRVVKTVDEQKASMEEMPYEDWFLEFDYVNNGFDVALIRKTTERYKVEDLKDWEFGEILIDEVATRASMLFDETRNLLYHVFQWKDIEVPKGFDMLNESGFFDKNIIFNTDALMMDPLAFCERFTNGIVTRDEVIANDLDGVYAAMSDKERDFFHQVFVIDSHMEWDQDEDRPFLVPIDTVERLIGLPVLFKKGLTSEGDITFNPYVIRLGSPEQDYQEFPNQMEDDGLN